MPFLAAGLGLLVGLSLGALGAGGSILTVPVLVYLLGQDAYTATTSSLLIVGATSLIALLPHARRHRVRAEGLLIGALGTAGSVAGATLSARVNPHLLLIAFAALMVVVAGLMLRRSTTAVRPAPAPAAFHRAGPLLGIRPQGCDRRRAATLVVTATAVGLLTGFFGVGGGFALVPALVLVLDYPMPAAVGTSLLIIAVNSATAFMARLSAGPLHLDWAVLVAFTVVTVAGSLVGARLASQTSPDRLQRAFAVLLVLVALYTGLRSALMPV